MRLRSWSFNVVRSDRPAIGGSRLGGFGGGDGGLVVVDEGGSTESLGIVWTVISRLGLQRPASPSSLITLALAGYS